jgi:ribosome-associated protein
VSENSILTITDDLFIPRAELSYRASRSGGPGGQHVNTSSTRVELAWNAATSPSLSEAQRALVLQKLANRINGEGELLLVGGESRSQFQNKESVTERFVSLLREALHVPKRRKKTRPTRASKEERLESKKRRSETKKMRGSNFEF